MKRLICWLFGHGRTAIGVRAQRYYKVCLRCHTEWDAGDAGAL